MTSRTVSDLRQLLHPYYVVGLLMSASFFVVKTFRPFCELLFDSCELDGRESEIYFFLIVVIALRTRRTKSTGVLQYVSTAAFYAKGANLILFFRADPRLGLLYALLFVLQSLLLAEPVYSGPEKLVYFRGLDNMKEELESRPEVTWLVAFYAAWSPACLHLAPAFARVSAEYNLDNLRFAKVDVGRYPDAGDHFNVNHGPLSQQLPTLALFEKGVETGRMPAVENGKVVQHTRLSTLGHDDIVNLFDLNNLHIKCKEKLANKKKSSEEKKKSKKEE